jgi:hypothetical protein
MVQAAIPTLLPFAASSDVKWKIDYGSPGHVGKDAYALDFNLRTGGDSDWGQPILASAAGTIDIPSPDFPGPGDPYGYGHWMMIYHGDGYWTVYAHLDQILVEDGDSVKQGQVIGLVGKTGLSSSYTTHLHWALWRNGSAVRPTFEEGYTGGNNSPSRTENVESINVMKRPVGAISGQYKPALTASVIDKFFDYRDKLGWPVDDGGGVLLHEWGFDPAQRWSWKWRGNYIQNFNGGDWGSCALVYNPDKGKTYTLHGGFWNVFRYGVGDGSGWGPTIAVAGKQLGFPESDEYSYGSEVRQDFSNGMMVWDGSDVHIYTEDGQKFLTTSDDGPIFALASEPVSSSKVRLSFPPVANASSYQIWINGFLAGSVSADSFNKQITQSAAKGQESVSITGMSPGMTIGVQVRAVDDQGEDLSRSPMAVAQSLQDFISIEPVNSNLLVKAAEPFALTVDAAGPSVLSFAWYCNGDLRATNNVPELYIDGAGWNEAGTWTVVAEDQSGASTSAEIQIHVSNLDYGHWQKAQIPSGSGIVGQSVQGSNATNDDWNTYAFGAVGGPAIAFSGAECTSAVLRVKRLFEPRDIIYIVHQTDDLLAGWTGVVSETSSIHIQPSTETPYGICEIDPMIASAPRAFFMAGAEAVGKRELVLYDDFEDNSLDTFLWSWQRSRVDETNGTLNVLTTASDSGGQAWTTPFPIGNDTIEVVRRTKLHAGNDYAIPRLSIRYNDATDKVINACSVFYGNMKYNSSKYSPVHGVVLGLGDANPHSKSNPNPWIQGPPVLWNTWFVEKLSFDNSTGLVRYSINGTEVMNGYAPTINPASEISVYIDAWGWWTGHKNLSDYIEVYLIDCGKAMPSDLRRFPCACPGY